MKLTKLVHSCLLVELANQKVVLIDPGEMSKELVAGLTLERLDYLCITHEHPDHFDLDTVKNLVHAWPEARVMAPQAIVDILVGEGIEAVTTGDDVVQVFEAPHEGTPPLISPPQAMGYHIAGVVSHPGDCHSFSESKAVLALPIAAPWGSTDRAVQLALELKPKYIVPIHDWMWKDEVRASMYQHLASVLEPYGITALQPVNGEAFELPEE